MLRTKEEVKPVLLTGDSNSITDASVWSAIAAPTDLSTGGKDMASSSSTSSSALGLLTDSYGAGYSYPSYPSSYTMYTSNPASYYQQVASGLRAQNAATAFPYGLAAANPTAYYGGSYPVDYSTYNQQYYESIRSAYYPNALSMPAAYGMQSAASSADATFDNSLQLKEKKSKTKKKKAGSNSPGDAAYARVFIWDNDDLCMLSRNIFAQLTQQIPHLVTSALTLKSFVDRVASIHFAEQTDECDMVNVDDVAVDDSINDGSIMDARGVEMMRRVAAKYISLRQLYQECASKTDTFQMKPEAPVNFELLKRCGMASEENEVRQSCQQIQTLLNQRWQCAARSLELVTTRSGESAEKYGNVAMCADGLVSGIAQILVAGHAPFIPIDNVYSTAKVGKEAVLEKIQSKFGKKCSFVVVTSNIETATIAKKLSIPVWPVSARDDLEKLYTAQRNYLLGG